MTEGQLRRLRARRVVARSAETAELARRAVLRDEGRQWFDAHVSRSESPSELVERIRQWCAGRVIRFLWAEWLENEHPDTYVSDEVRDSHWPHWYAGIKDAARAFAEANGLEAG